MPPWGRSSSRGRLALEPRPPGSGKRAPCAIPPLGRLLRETPFLDESPEEGASAWKEPALTRALPGAGYLPGRQHGNRADGCPVICALVGLEELGSETHGPCSGGYPGVWPGQEKRTLPALPALPTLPSVDG